MARLTIEDRWWTDPRRERLSEIVGGIDHADVVAVKAWRLAQEFWKQAFGLVPKALFFRLKHPEALIDAGLADVQGEAVYVRGSRDYLTWAAEMREAASIGGKKSAQRPRDAKGRLKKTSKRTPSDVQANSKAVQVSDSDSVFVFDSSSGSDSENFPEPEKKSVSQKIWESYENAYWDRYQTAPLRNAEVNSKIKQLASRLPGEDAPFVAEFYVRHNHRYYVDKKHPIGLLLADAQKVWTEWKAGKAETSSDANTVERRAGTINAFARHIDPEAGHG
jgi:hypothetical protein